MSGHPLILGAIAALCVAISSGQSPAQSAFSPHVEIAVPPTVPSERLLVRYVLSGQDLGGELYGPAGVSAFGISTVWNGQLAAGIKAILYAPGCAIQTLDLKASDSAVPHYSFVCEPIPNVELRGVLTGADRFKRPVKLQARYLVRWANLFFQLEDTLVTGIPVGEMASLSSDGRFRIALPGAALDRFADLWNRPGEFRIFAKDESTGTVAAMIVPQKSERTRMGGLKTQAAYPDEITFAACASPPLVAHNSFGFAIRSDTSDQCAPF